MNLLEARFRQRFRRDGAEYRFVRGGREVWFSEGEVEAFVEEWRLLWLGPLVWGIWLVLGVAAPLLLWWNDMAAGALTLALIVAAFVVAVLMPALLKPGEVAQARLPFEADDGWKPAEHPSWFQLFVYGVVFLTSIYELLRHGVADLTWLNFFFLWGGLFLMQGWQIFRYRHGKAVPGRLDVVSGAITGTMCVAVVVTTALNPARGTFDVVLAGMFGAIALLIAWTALWKRRDATAA